ncbi:MAG: hypothetical protein NXY57DRAFT_1078187 [Lentinula lateritia]|nr:MAG: hypothetical protein NXY57DRAFT_1078187 [Lentinula lateritia]
MNFHSQPVAADSVLSSQLPNLMHHPPSTQQSLSLSSQPSLPPSSQLSGRVPLQSSVLQPSTTLNQPIQAPSLSPQPLVPLSSQLSGMVPLQSSVFHPSTALNQSIQASSSSSQPISPSVPSDSTAQGSQPQPPLLSDHTAFLPPPSQCRPYSSLQMLSSLRSTPSTGSGLVGTIPTQGHPRVTTSSGFPSMTTIAHSNQTRLEHASISLPWDPPKKHRGKATKPPSIGQPLAPTV